MYGEYVEKLKAFSRTVDGEYNYTSQPTTTLKRMGWSRVEIRIPHSGADLFYIAFSGTNSAEVYSGFYAQRKLPARLFCRISQKDGFSSLLSTFSSYRMKSGRPSFDKKLQIACNDKGFLLKLTGDHGISSFLESHIQMPLRFEVMTNEKGILKDTGESAMLISLNTNEWIVDQKQLMELMAGFRKLVDHIG